MFNFKLKRDTNTIFSQCKPVGCQNKLLGGTDGPIRESSFNVTRGGGMKLWRGGSENF